MLPRRVFNFLKIKLDLKLDDLNQFDHKLNIENYLYKIKHQKNIEKWIKLRKVFLSECEMK